MIRNKIRSFLAARGITPYRFKSDVGISASTAYALVNDPRRKPSVEVVEKICDRYEIQPNEILEWVSDG